MDQRDRHDANDSHNRQERRSSNGSPHTERNNKKRKHHERRSPSSLGMGSTLARLQLPDLPVFNLTSDTLPGRSADLSKQRDADKSEEWQTVEERHSKKAKKIPGVKSTNYPAISFHSDCRLQSQIKISDLQGLALYILADGTSPQWVSVRHRPQIRKVVVLMVPGLERSMFGEGPLTQDNEDLGRRERDYKTPDEYYPVRLASEKLPSQLKHFADMFEHLWPVKTPGDDKYSKMHSPLHAMLTVPLAKRQEYKDMRGAKPAKEPQGWQNKRTRITEYISSADELLENEYTLHPAMYTDKSDIEALQEQRKRSGTSTDDAWVDTAVSSFEDGSVLEKDIEQGSLTAGREVLAIDCEMCMTGEKEFSLTRISIVSWDGSVVLDELVKPDKPIIDYVTQYSGITEAMLAPITTSLRDIQQKLVEILHPQTILIGHSLNSDLTALKITHPFIVDTSILYPHPRGAPLKSSLKWLAQKYLGREVQKGHGATGAGAGHDSVEDSRTCLDLVKQKCEKGPQWGTNDSTGENIFKRLTSKGVRYKNQGGSAVPSGQSGGRSTAIVDWGDPKKGPGAAADIVIGCNSDEDVTQGVIRAVNGDPDGLEVPGGGVDFVFARLRELEALKGWWNNNRSSDGAALAVPGTLAEAAAKINVEAEVPPAVSRNSEELKKELKKEEEPAEEATLEEVEVNTTSVSENAADRSSDSTTSDTSLETATVALTARLYSIYESLPPCTAFIIYSGSGDPREMSRLQTMQQTFKREYKIKKWDQLSVKWTDVEEQALRRAAKEARDGMGFVTVK